MVMFAVLMVHNVDQPDQVCQKIPESSYSLLCEILLCIFIYLQFHTMYLFCNMMENMREILDVGRIRKLYW